MNEAYFYIIRLSQEKQHYLPVSLASHKQDLPDNERRICLTTNPYAAGALSAFHTFLSEDESGINKKLRSAAKSRQAHSDSEESSSRSNHRNCNDHSQPQRWNYRPAVPKRF